MAIHIDHIRDVSFKNYFLDVDRNAPKNGQIEVNKNTFEVSFDNGRVNARFTSGNWFSNLFRGKTMRRSAKRPASPARPRSAPHV